MNIFLADKEKKEHETCACIIISTIIPSSHNVYNLHFAKG